MAIRNLNCHHADTGISFLGCTVWPDTKETKLGSSNQEASLSAIKNTGVILVPCHARKFVLTAISCGADIPKVPASHLLQHTNSQWGLQNSTRSVSNELTAYLSDFYLYFWFNKTATLSKVCKSDSFESHNSLKLTFNNTQCLSFDVVECESFLEINSSYFYFL